MIPDVLSWLFIGRFENVLNRLLLKNGLIPDKMLADYQDPDVRLKVHFLTYIELICLLSKRHTLILYSI